MLDTDAGNTYLQRYPNTSPVVISREAGGLQTVGYAAPKRARVSHEARGVPGPLVTPNAPINRQLDYDGQPALYQQLYLRRL